MTARQFAAAIDRPYSTVALWLRQHRIKGAFLLEVGTEKLWQIPESCVKTFTPPKPGRPAKKKAKKAGN